MLLRSNFKKVNANIRCWHQIGNNYFLNTKLRSWQALLQHLRQWHCPSDTLLFWKKVNFLILVRLKREWTHQELLSDTSYEIKMMLSLLHTVCSLFLQIGNTRIVIANLKFAESGLISASWCLLKPVMIRNELIVPQP